MMWFAARTRYGQEVSIRDRLQKKFIPTEKRRNSHGRVVEKPLVNNLVFLRTSRRAALDLANKEYLPVHYMIDCVSHTLLTVPDRAMEDFMRVFDYSTDHGGLMDRPLELGEGVRVTRGPLKGVEGYVLEVRGRTFVVVELIGCLWAKAKVPRAWLEPTGKRRPVIT